VFSFIHRIELPGGPPISVDDHEMVLSTEADGRRVVLTSRDADTPLSKTKKLFLEGHGFESESAAREAGIQWRSILERAFACVRAAADFGDRAQRAVLSLATEGQRIFNDRHQLIIYESEPPPTFVFVGPAWLHTTPSREVFERALASEGSRVRTTAAESLAFDLYSASFAVRQIVDARFMLLWMALETLIDQEERGEESQHWVDEMIAMTSEADLSEEKDRNSMVGSLKWLKRESISQAGKRLVRELGDRRYNDMTPVKFFEKCYDVRNLLAHGYKARPGRDQVDRLAAHLEILVGDLIAGTQLLDDTNFRATS
jgi:hypothetical protein